MGLERGEDACRKRRRTSIVDKVQQGVKVIALVRCQVCREAGIEAGVPQHPPPPGSDVGGRSPRRAQTPGRA
jgi:hypothetical protein